MNQQRRKAIEAIKKELAEARTKVEALGELTEDHDKLRTALAELGDAGLDDIASSIEDPKDEEQEYFDNMPEGLQGSERGQMAESAVENLELASEKAADAKEALEELSKDDADLSTAEDAIASVLDAIDEADGALDEAAA